MAKSFAEIKLFHVKPEKTEQFEAMVEKMSAAVFRGILHGYVRNSFRDAAEAAYRTVAEKTDGMGLIREVCGCPDFISEGTSAEAQAAFIMADAWRKKLMTEGNDIHE